MIRVFLVFVFLISFKGIKGDMTYLLGDGNASWRSASSTCTLATPRINFIGGEMIAEVTNAQLMMQEGDEAWVGYSLAPVILQYVGCMAYDIGKEPNLARYYDTGADPGRCFSACREVGYIGLMDTQCFCLQKLPMESRFETECTLPCSSINDQTICGGRNFVSIYKQAENILPSDVLDYNNLRLGGNCIMYDKNVDMYYTRLCSISHRIGCQNNFGQPMNIGTRTVTWLQMTRFCFSQKLFTYDHVGVLADDGTYLTMWTGMIKANKLAKYPQWDNNLNTFAYMKVKNGYFKLHFSVTQNTAKRFLCQIGETTASTTTTTPNPIPETPEGKPEPEVNVTSEPEPESTVTSEPEPEPVAEGSISNLLPVFIIIPMVIIAVAIVLVFLFVRWKRRKRNEQLKSKAFIKGETGTNKRNQTLTEKSRLSRENVGMYDIMQNENNPVTENDKPGAEQRPLKRVLNPNFSNNLHATLPLDNAPTANIDETEAVSASNGSKVVKPDNEYARINKVLKVSTPKVPGDKQTYDKLGKENKIDDNLRQTRNYDKVKLETESEDKYDTTVKPRTFPATDKVYDGLSRF